MSFLDELKKFFDMDNDEDKNDYTNDLGDLDEEDVVTAIANRNFSRVYPPSSHWASIERFINPTSPLTQFISFFGNFLFVFSSALLIAFIIPLFLTLGMITMAIAMGSGHILEGTFAFYVMPFLIGASGLTTSLLLRKLDRVITMKKYISEAKSMLENRQIYHREHCQLEMEKSVANMEPKIGEYKKRINKHIHEIDILENMSRRLQEIPDLDSFEMEEKIAQNNKYIKELRQKISELVKAKNKTEGDLKKQKAKFLASIVMSDLINVGDTLLGLEDGTVNRQIDELNESARDSIKQIESKTENIQDDLLSESGLITIDDKKPKSSK